MPFRIIREDITRVRADAIVNTANPEPVAGRGTDKGIYRAAGYGKLLKARRKIGRIAVGEAAVTKAFGLPARYIIHTVGPVWHGGSGQEFEALASCYRKSLLLAEQLGCRSIAFPLISAGNDRFPKEKALEIALREIRGFLRDGDPEKDMDVTLAVFNRAVFRLSEEMTGPVRAYIDEKYVSEKREQEYGAHYTMALREDVPESGTLSGSAPSELSAGTEEYDELFEFSAEFEMDASADELFEFSAEFEMDAPAKEPVGSWNSAPLHQPQATEVVPPLSKPKVSEAVPPLHQPQSSEAVPSLHQPQASEAVPPLSKPKASRSSGKWRPGKGRKLSDLKNQVGETYQQCLLRLIDENGYTDAEVYKKANIDRRLFSKIRSNPSYHPKKQTALALAMALELNLDETLDLIGRAGIALSDASLFDIIIEYCIENRIYDLFTVNAILFEYDQPLLGQ